MSLVFWTVLVLAIATPQDFGLRVTPKDDATVVEVTVDLPKDVAGRLVAGKVSQDDGETWLQLCLVTDGKEGQPMLGDYKRDGQKLLFTPRVPLQNDKTYHACFFQDGKKVATVAYKVPARPRGPAAEVVAVWPTDDVLPANHLRFYIQFNRPMRGGEDIFSQIHLLDAKGEEVFDPWLPDELWSEDGTLLTLLIHPGRIKWGVLLRDLLGPVLEPNHSYTLVVTTEMLDADSRKLAKEFRKKFKASDEDRTRIELSSWKVSAPKAGEREAVALSFGKTIDHKGLEQFLKVVDAKGQAVPGKVVIGNDGRSWKFTPDQAWSAQDYSISVDRQLEDICGNTAMRPFDVDADAPVPAAQRLTVTFRPQKA